MRFFCSYEEFRKAHIKKTIKKGIVLDAGCGDGRLFKEYKVIGVDVCKKALKKNPNQTIIADIRKLPFKANSINQIFCLEVLEHLKTVKDVIKVLEEFYRVLKPSGFLIIYTPNRERLNLRLRKMFGFPKTYPFFLGCKYGTPRFHYWEFTKDELKKLLEDCGFKVKIYAAYLNFPFIAKFGLPIKTSLGRSLIVEAIKLKKV